MRHLGITLLLLLLAVACAPRAPATDTSPGVAPVYVSIVCHNEQPKNATAIAYSEDREYFLQNRNATVEFARMLHSEGVAFNFQSDWDFVLGVLKFDEGSHSTGDKNVLCYLVQNLDFEVDPHAHETRFTYADVAHLHEQAGVPVSHLAGGFIALPPEDSKLEHLCHGISGQQFECEWQAEVIWGAGTSGHQNEEDLWISGIWKPKDAGHFTEHDDSAPLPHIGGYMKGWDGLRDLLEHQRNGELDSAKLYTQTVFVRQGEMLKPAYVEEFLHELRSFSEETEQGLIRWVGLNEVVDIWKDKYGSEPNMFPYS